METVGSSNWSGPTYIILDSVTSLPLSKSLVGGWGMSYPVIIINCEYFLISTKYIYILKTMGW
jgi:hypothetical protein